MNESFNYLIFIYLYVLCLCIHVYATAHMWSSQDNVRESVLCFDHVDSMDWMSGQAASASSTTHETLETTLCILFFFLRFVLFIIFSYIFICLCTLSAGALRGQRHQIRSGIEVSGNVSLPNWELVTELRSWCKSSMCSQLRSHHSSPCNFLHSYKYLFRHLLIIAEHFSVPCFVFYAKKSTKTCI